MKGLCTQGPRNKQERHLRHCLPSTPSEECSTHFENFVSWLILPIVKWRTMLRLRRWLIYLLMTIPRGTRKEITQYISFRAKYFSFVAVIVTVSYLLYGLATFITNTLIMLIKIYFRCGIFSAICFSFFFCLDNSLVVCKYVDNVTYRFR